MALPTDPYIYEFLYRGQPPGSPREPGWHLIIAQEGVGANGEPTHTERVFNMAQAETAKLGLPAIIATLNGAALAEVDRLRAGKVAADSEIENLQIKLAEAEAKIPKPRTSKERSWPRLLKSKNA